MSACPFQPQLSAYLDGELPPSQRVALFEHLQTCESCAKELSQLSAISAMFTAMPVATLSPFSQHRLHARLDDAMNQSLRHIAWSLSAIAATVLLVGSIWLLKPPQPQAAPPWVGVAAATDPVVRDADTPAAEWYLADASTS